MANFTRTIRPVLGSPEPDLVLFDGYVQLSSSGAIVAQDILGVTVSKTGTGQYTFTFSSDCQGIFRSVDVTLVSSAPQSLATQVKSFTNAPSTAVIINLLSGSTPTDVTSASGLMFDCSVKKSALAR